jgi:hypothetical protein
MKGNIMKRKTKDITLPKGFEAISNFMNYAYDANSNNNYFFYLIRVLNFKDKRDEAYVRFLPAKETTLPGDIKCECSVFDLNTAHATKHFMFDTILQKIEGDTAKNKELPWVCYAVEASDSKIDMYDFQNHETALWQVLESMEDKADWTYVYVPSTNVFYIYNV